MTETTVHGISVDVCEGGCGGLWFDWLELKKVDEQHEAVGQSLLDAPRDPSVVVDHESKRDCPHCDGITMMRHFTSVNRDVEVDECGACGGVFLDHGELNGLRSEFATEEERSEAARALFATMYDADLDDLADESAEIVERSRGLASMFRFMLPSHWLPGKQKWGAF
jgi:Zn-finger nucleic acid-binding protein